MPSSPRLGSSLNFAADYQPIVSTCSKGEEESSPFSHVALTDQTWTTNPNVQARCKPFYRPRRFCTGAEWKERRRTWPLAQEP